jgi:hypothetical protein
LKAAHAGFLSTAFRCSIPEKKLHALFVKPETLWDLSLRSR